MLKFNRGTLYLNRLNGQYYLDVKSEWLLVWWKGAWQSSWHTRSRTKTEAFTRVGNNYAPH